jgi:hypothetical protein
MALNDADFRDAAQRAGMSFYPWEPLPAELESDRSGDALTDRGMTRLSRHLSARQAVLTYLHEACHLIAHRFRLEYVGEGSTTAHTAHFAALVAICYRRIDRLHMLKLYDFGDTADIENGKPVNESATMLSSDAMARRLGFILRTCERYAATSMSIEDIAADLARQRRAAAAARSAAQRRKAQRGNWIAGTVGVLLSIGLLVGGRVLGLI